MKLLMLLYFYPPVQAVGAVRNTALVDQFRRLGVTPLVITAANPDAADWIKIGKEPAPAGVSEHRVKGIPLARWVDLFGGVSNRCHRLLFGRPQPYNWLREKVFFPDLLVTYQRAFWKCACDLISRQQIDAVFLSCSPFSTAMLAPRFKKSFPDLKIIVDFRDAWSLNPHIAHTPGHLQRVKKLEAEVMAVTDLFVANTPGMARLYRQAYPRLRIVAVPNGYDRLTPRSGSAERFIVVHTGNFYGRRNPDLLLQALHKVRRPVEFWQIGSAITHQVDNPMATIRQFPFMPRAELMVKMEQAAMFYLKQGFEGAGVDHIAIAAKTFEYLATGVPILADVPEGDNAELIRSCHAESFVVTSQSSDALCDALHAAYDRWQSGAVRYEISEKFIRDYSREGLAGKLLEEIRTVTAAEHVQAGSDRPD